MPGVVVASHDSSRYSALGASLTGARLAARMLRRLIADGIRPRIPSLVLYEWRRGPRRPDEIAAQEIIVPASAAFHSG